MRWGAFGVYLLVVGLLGVAAGLWWASSLSSSFDQCELTNTMRDVQGTLAGLDLEADQCIGPGRGQVVAAVSLLFVIVGAGFATAGRRA